jgi:hypothetical protein
MPFSTDFQNSTGGLDFFRRLEETTNNDVIE